MSDETAADPGPWTVKKVPPEVRDEINRAAKRANVSVGQWIAAATDLAIRHERGHLAPIPAGPPVEHPEASLVSPSLAVVVALASHVLPGMTEAERAGKLGQATRAVMHQHLNALRLHPPKPRLAAPED